jgi:hypothetical protein
MASTPRAGAMLAATNHSVTQPLYTAVIAMLTASLLILGGCGGVKIAATTNIPTPLVSKIPVAVALYMPKEFADYVHKEERWSTKWNVELGHAQTEALTRLLNAMFERVVTVDSVNAGAQLGGGIRAILEPSVEEYAFVTPRDAGSPFYAVSIKYRMNVYAPDGRLADSWGFTGYGTAPAAGISSASPLTDATALAMRDAGAKLAVEFRDQAVVRGLLPDEPPASGGEMAPVPVAPVTSEPIPSENTNKTPAAAPASVEPKSQAPASEVSAPAAPPPPSTSPPKTS